ncbi:NAD(P)-dependent dehydrogenase (short-subunit alcohol dehydrogenase family) [Methylopila capsulata]|uniref:Glucose-1-dehydrogenase n=1 Tax=Methylopila capsulata TaxID=61654 RepID=A0A9W6IWN2_9HYPH|nr:SDR family oxidoreductase [Methylopila capsulata]MBM7853223.1 NAD(P)-dependent dehydrogenase (short-subunit alcohol dehydrogenase family) [Methylopila capsulata]GLK57563.1 glucose-1-dehydrogenase [Methylopila capsulata]
MNDQGKVLIVTGGGRGIGAAVCRLAARDGWDVAVNYARDKAAAEKVADEVRAFGRKATVVQGDVAIESDVRNLFDMAQSALGPARGVVNNAGITGAPAGKLADAAADMLKDVVALNVTGALLVAREAARTLSTARGGQGGSIVNLSSAAASLGSPGEFVWYAATKGAIDSLTIGLSRELAAEGVRVNAVSPGLIETEIHAASGQPDRLERMAPGIPIGRAGTAEETAEAIVWLLSDAASYVTGANIRVAGGR